MALTPWKKGQSGNPAGRPALPAIIREARRTHLVALINMTIDLMTSTDEVIEKRLDDHMATPLETAICRQIHKATKDGDLYALEFLLKVMVGNIPVDEELDVSEEEGRVLQRAKEILSEKRRKIPKSDD